MSSPIEQLAELLHQAEGKARVLRIQAEMDQAAQRLREVNGRFRKAEAWARETRPALQRALDRADADEQQLKELVRKAAQFKAHLDEGSHVEDLIAASQSEIDARQQKARSELEAGTRELEDVRRELHTADDHYAELRRERDRLLPQLAVDYAAADRLAQEVQSFFPGARLQALAREIEDGDAHFGQLDRAEQYAQLRIWIGRLKQLQTLELSEAEVILSRQLFPRLVGISKEHQPGYIEAFQPTFTADWDEFVAEAEQQLVQATEAASRKRDLERQQVEQQTRERERQRQAREAGLGAMEELKVVIARTHLPTDGADEFRAALAKVVSYLGASDEPLLELVMPYRDLLDGGEFRAIRRNLDRVRQQEQGKNDDSNRENYQDLVAATQGRKVLMIGGVAREEVRRVLERIFDFHELDWETYEDTKPAMLESLEQRVRNRGVDLVLILKGFVRHHVSEKFRPLCEQHGIPCLMVEHGYGPAQVAETLRRGLLRTA